MPTIRVCKDLYGRSDHILPYALNTARNAEKRRYFSDENGFKLFNRLV